MVHFHHWLPCKVYQTEDIRRLCEGGQRGGRGGAGGSEEECEWEGGGGEREREVKRNGEWKERKENGKRWFRER